MELESFTEFLYIKFNSVCMKTGAKPFLKNKIEHKKLVHVVLYIILGRYFGMIYFMWICSEDECLIIL